MDGGAASCPTSSVWLAMGWILLLLLLVALLFPMSLIRQKEAFAIIGRTPGADMAEMAPSIFCDYQTMFEMSGADSRGPLLYRTCMGIKDPNRDYEKRMDAYIKTLGYLINKQTIRTNDTKDVIERIAATLETIRASNGPHHKLQGPVYAMIFQAPFYRDLRTGIPGNHSEIAIQPFNVMEYKYSASVILRNMVEGASIHSMDAPNPGLFFLVYLVCPMYDPTNRFRDLSKASRGQSINACLKYFLDNTTNEALCKVKCAKSDVLRCGCLNRKVPYAATCLGPNAKDDRQKTNIISYSIMYRINERDARMSNLFEESAYYQDQCTGKIK